MVVDLVCYRREGHSEVMLGVEDDEIYVSYPALQEIFDMFKVTEKNQVPKMEVTYCMGPYEDSLQPKNGSVWI